MSTATATRGSLAKIRDEFVFKPHQIEGVRWLAKRSSSILADEMGLGKTIECLAVVAIGFEQNFYTRALFVTPASLKGNWAEEIEAHTNFSYTVLDGSPKRRAKQLAEFDTDILIVNYEQVVSHLNELNAMNFGLVGYDEAQYLQNHRSGRTKACLRLTAPRHILLTGSPILNQADGAWPLLNRIDPATFPDYWRFVNRFCVFGGFKDKQIVGIKNEAELREKLQERMLRREAKDVLDLPKVTFIPVKIDLSPLQRKLYEQMKEELRVEAPGLDEGELLAKNPMTKALHLKMICGSAGVIDGHPDDSAKLDRAQTMALEVIQNGDPIVIFTQFRDIQRFMVARLEALGVDTIQLHGDIPIPNRVPIVRQWTDDAKAGRPKAIVCMYQVAGVGLNMTVANKMIRLDKLYVPELNKQAYKRLDRIGQTRPITVWDLFMRNTIDTRIEAINKMKSDIFDTLVAADNSAWKKMLIAAVLADSDDDV
jgi:SNF2 family DNA or RNA helicase